ncbi:hypothetical protein OOT08_16060, partial [Leucobacter sp. M11]|nr:hypothetical protein [Leucobacter sp. M11]
MIQRPAPGAGRALRRDARLLRDWAPARGLTPLRLLDAAPGASRWLLGPDPVAGDPRRRDSAPPARSGVRELILVREPRRGPEAGWAALPPRERRARHSEALQLLAGLGT